MSKFFTRYGLLGVACFRLAVASENMNPAPIPEASPAVEKPAATLPAGLSAGRFSALGKKSPFTLASSTEEVVDFAKDLILAGYFRMDGKDFVMVANRTRPERILVGAEASPSAQGLVLVRVDRDPSGDATKLKAQVRKGSETATLKYEAAAAPGGAPATPGAAAQPGNMAQPAVVPPAIPGIPQPAQANPAAPGQPASKPAVIRRRVIPIPPAIGR